MMKCKSKTIRVGKHYCIYRKELEDFKNVSDQIYSETEKEFYKIARKNGWFPIKSGWPDFLIMKNGEIAFVEVKQDHENLRHNQERILNVLANHGFNCFVWRPSTGFQKLKKLPGSK